MLVPVFVAETRSHKGGGLLFAVVVLATAR
jgi:hypothetical protein